MSSKKTIVVIGATGNQGGSVARAFLSSPSWHVRAVTRDPSSAASQALQSAGATVVKGDLTDPASLIVAFTGAHAIFVNTDFWGVYRPLAAQLAAAGRDVVEASAVAFDAETRSGKNAVDAASSPEVLATLERFVYSALPPVARASGGRYPRSKHLEAKAWVAEYLEREWPELAGRASLVYCGAYIDHRMLVPSKLDAETGVYKFVVPAVTGETRIPITDQRKVIGAFVRELVESEEPGTKLLAYNDYLSFQQIVDAWSAAAGKKSEIVTMSARQMHEGAGVPWELLDGITAMSELGYMLGVEGHVEPAQLRNKVKVQSYADYLAEGNWKRGAAA